MEDSNAAIADNAPLLRCKQIKTAKSLFGAGMRGADEKRRGQCENGICNEGGFCRNRHDGEVLWKNGAQQTEKLSTVGRRRKRGSGNDMGNMVVLDIVDNGKSRIVIIKKCEGSANGVGDGAVVLRNVKLRGVRLPLQNGNN